jgi:D-alanyl-D-alanine carboxypeptidase
VSLLVSLLAGLAVLGGGEPAERSATAGQPRFEADTKRITGKVRKKITGSSWRPGCPVPRRNLRLIRASFWDFQRDVERGALIVHKREKREMIRALRALFDARFRIRKMDLIDRYGADDHRSMNADNTSAFNCRFVAGTTRWSEHAYGRAIDINPIENPYVTPSGHVSPPAGRPYTDRSRRAKGMVHHGDEAWDAFRDVGWKWGGDWSGTKDYQHFSATGH